MIALLALGAVARAQQQAATSAPAAAQRYQLVVPAGYEKVGVGGNTAVCLAGDVAWVRQALGAVTPATRPTTMPADLLKRIAENRAAVVKEMTADFGLADDKEPNRFFDELLIPTLKKLDELRPPVYLLVCTREQLRDLVATGWGEPRFRYNRVAGAVSIDDRISLAIDRPMDDTVLPAMYPAGEAVEARVRRLTGQVRKLNGDLAQTVANEGPLAVVNRLGQHIDERYLAPLKLRRDQEWLAMGVNGYFTCKYAARLTGYPRERLTREMTYEDRRFPVSGRSIDLTHPADPATLRPGAAPYYNQAMRRKAMVAVITWAEKAGEGSITKVLVALRQGPPADGAGMVKLVREVGGVDLSKELAQ